MSTRFPRFPPGFRQVSPRPPPGSRRGRVSPALPARFPPGFRQVSARACARETQVSPRAPSAGGAGGDAGERASLTEGARAVLVEMYLGCGIASGVTVCSLKRQF